MATLCEIYVNELGISFYWNQLGEMYSDKIQLVFKETGFNLTLAELEYFSKLIIESKSKIQCCSDCKVNTNCSRFLLQTPAKQIDLAVSVTELEGIQDLVDGTIFKIKLKNYVHGISRN